MVTVQDNWAEFSFYRPDADDVFVAGDFNEWRHGQLAMSPDDNGYWTARLRLPAGEFKFRYCADGQWFTDYAAFGVEPGRFGMDSIVRISPAPLKVVPATAATSADVAAA